MRARRFLIGLAAVPAAAGLLGAAGTPATASPAPSSVRPAVIRPTVIRPAVIRPVSFLPAASVAPAVSATTSTTIAGIQGRVPVVPATVPFTTRAPNAHVDPIFARLAYWGAGAFVLLVVIQLVLTRPGRRGRRTL